MKELMQMIGKKGHIRKDEWFVFGQITDVKKVYGIEKLELTQLNAFDAPVAHAWINRDSFVETN